MRKSLLFGVLVFCIVISISGVYGLNEGISGTKCRSISEDIGVVPHYGIIPAEEGVVITLGKAYGFEGAYILKAISLKPETMTVSINGEVGTVGFQESAIIGGINFTYARRSGTKYKSTKEGTVELPEVRYTDYAYCAFELLETRLKLTCQGCVKDNTCLPIGTRLSSGFCDIDKNIKPLKSVNEACINNFECTSNLCENSECISIKKETEQIKEQVEKTKEEIKEAKEDIKETKGLLAKVIAFLKDILGFGN